MSVDADDLFERAAHALDRNMPTIEEVTVDLADALDKLERDFPDGHPGFHADPLTRLEYSNSLIGPRHGPPRGGSSRMGSASSIRAEDAPALRRANPEGGELPPGPSGSSPRHRKNSLTTSYWKRYGGADEKRNARHLDRRHEGVLSSFVADELWGIEVTGRGDVPLELRPTRGDVSRVGKALSRLTRDGRVRRTNRSWEPNFWAPKR